MTAYGQSLPLPRRYFASGAYYRRNSACRLFGKQLAPIGQAGSLPPLEAEQLEEVFRSSSEKCKPALAAQHTGLFSFASAKKPGNSCWPKHGSALRGETPEPCH